MMNNAANYNMTTDFIWQDLSSIPDGVVVKDIVVMVMRLSSKNSIHVMLNKSIKDNVMKNADIH